MITLLIAALALSAGAFVLLMWLRSKGGDETGPVSIADDLDAKFRAEWTDADVYVARARRLWPSLQTNPFFWSGATTSTMICYLGFMGSTSLAQGVAAIAILYCLAFVAANLLQAAIAVLGDHGRGEWYEFKRGDRPVWHWPILVVLLFVNFVASITGSSNVAEVLQTTSEINVSSLESRREELKRSEQSLSAVYTRLQQEAPGQTAGALQALADEKSQAAEREGDRGGCQSKCEALKKEAVRYQALANDAMAAQKLEEEIAVMRAKLQDTAADGTARTVASPHAHFVEEATGGSISERQVNTYLSPLFWLMISAVDIAVWLWAGDYAGRYRMEQYRTRAEQANFWLENAGLKPRYTINSDGEVTDVKALTGPDVGPGDTINIDLSESAEAKIQKSPRLKQIQYLFDSVLIRSEGHKIPIGRAYELFAKIRSEQGEKQYMNPPDFRAAITDYCDLMGIPLLSNQIVGYKIGLAQAQINEAAE